MKQEKGHLIIHGITVNESKKLLKNTKCKADWWTNEDISLLDSGYGFAVLTHGYKQAKEALHLN